MLKSTKRAFPTRRSKLQGHYRRSWTQFVVFPVFFFGLRTLAAGDNTKIFYAALVVTNDYRVCGTLAHGQPNEAVADGGTKYVLRFQLIQCGGGGGRADCCGEAASRRAAGRWRHKEDALVAAVHARRT